MPTPNEILSRLSEERFEVIMAASPKKLREDLFRRAGVRPKAASPFALKTQNSGGRSQKLFEAMQSGTELPEELLEELIRNYLYNRRDMLADALDFFEVEHNDGLTDADLEFIESLAADKVAALRTRLSAKHDDEDIGLYLSFMNFPHA